MMKVNRRRSNHRALIFLAISGKKKNKYNWIRAIFGGQYRHFP